MPSQSPQLRLSTQIADRHEVAPLWRLWLPLAAAAGALALHLAVPDWSKEVIFSEGWGPVELLHFLIPLAATAVALRAFLALPRGAGTGLRALLIVMALGTFYIAGEEQSWGQHFFGWETPEEWAEINRQQETNLHNTTSWLNHKPRVILNLAVLIGSIALPLAALWGRGGWLRERFAFVLPGKTCHPVGWLVIFYMVWDSLRKDGFVPRISSREAEMHELFLYLYLLLYVITLSGRVAAWKRAH